MPKKKTTKKKKVSVDDRPVFYMTAEGLEKLKEELVLYKNVKRKEVAERIKEAIAFGDLSENDEYKEAKNEQAFIEGFIVDTEYKIKNVSIIDEVSDKSKVQIGSTVVIKNAKEKNGEEKYTIVGFMEADPLKGKISSESPIGSAIIGKTSGEKVKVKAPAGEFEYQIVDIK